MTRRIIALVVLSFVFALLFTSCKAPSPHYQVRHRGAIKTLMHEGDLRAVMALDTLQHLPNLFALGAVENLKGEILVYESRVFVSSVRDGEVIVTRDFNDKAALLVYTQIEQWQEIEIPSEVQSANEIEVFVVETAKQRGLNLDAPLPFLITGAAAFVDWHVIDWAESDTVHTHEKHKASGLHGRLEHQAVELLGFHSDKHQGIFTHRNNTMHLHVKTVDGELAAHVDDLKLNGNTRLFLPSE